MNEKSSSGLAFFEALAPKTAFVVGAVTAFLSFGTLGFFVVGGCVLSESCGIAGNTTVSAKTQPAPTPTPTNPEPAPSGPVPAVTEADHVRGPKNAKITLIEYSDFECPFCARFQPSIDQVLQAYPNDVKLVFRHFPLSFHAEAEPSAEAAECAGEQGKFWEFHDKLFANQSALSDGFYTQVAQDLGLNAQKFADCRASDRMLSKIRTQLQEGSAAGVNGTPGSFVVSQDGTIVPIRGAQPFDAVKAAIDSLL